ncbi:MAG: Wzz/FepE/Etk N-terminal domain-containing protein [Faecalibacterium sp.]
MRPQQEEDTIDLLELCMGLLDHWKFIAAAAAAGAVLAALYTFLLVTPLYKATSTIYVVSRDDSVLNLSDIQIGSALTSDYIKVFEMWEVHEKVISALDLDYTYSQMDRHAQRHQRHRHPDAGHYRYRCGPGGGRCHCQRVRQGGQPLHFRQDEDR